jgi:hypothetical protein
VKWIRNPGIRITCATNWALHAFGGVAVFETRFTQEQTVAYTQGAHTFACIVSCVPPESERSSSPQMHSN